MILMFVTYPIKIVSLSGQSRVITVVGAQCVAIFLSDNLVGRQRMAVSSVVAVHVLIFVDKTVGRAGRIG